MGRGCGTGRYSPGPLPNRRSLGLADVEAEMAQVESDVCLVCADPLDFTAFGVCGHNEVCSRCVARMRIVLKDKGCVFCRQECGQVFFTRFMGDYTARLGPEDFDKLKVGLVASICIAFTGPGAPGIPSSGLSSIVA